MNLAPIILFVYNRPEHLKETFMHLSKNDIAESSDLFIYSDGAKSSKDLQKVLRVRDYIRGISGFKSIRIIERRNNYGLANSVISGVTDVLKEYTRVIVIEDDLIVSKDFLRFMNAALDFYEKNPRIFSVSGYNFPINIPAKYNYDFYVSYRASSWGWGTWRDRWNKADWEVKDFQEFRKNKNTQRLLNRSGEDLTPMLIDQMNGKIDSWAVRWCYAHFKSNAFCLYPIKSKVRNIGMDNSGRHAKRSDKFDTQITESACGFRFNNDIEVDVELMNSLRDFFKKSSVRRVINRFKVGLFSIRRT